MTAKQTPKIDHLIRDEITAFVNDRLSRKLSPRTIAYYQHELDWFAAWLDKHSITRMDGITADIIRQYQIDLGETRNAGGLHATWRAIKAWLNWYELEIDNPAYKNPIKKVSAPKVSKEPLPGIALEDVKKLVSACNPKHEHGQRDRAIIVMLVDTGLRKEELVALNVGDVNMRTGAVSVWHGKGDKSRTVILGASGRRELQRYLRNRNSPHPDDPLFLNHWNTRLTGSGLRQIIRRRAADAQVSEPGLHDFRRTFAIESLRNGIDLITLMHLMGHTDTVVLQRYLKLIEKDLQHAHTISSPGDMI